MAATRRQRQIAAILLVVWIVAEVILVAVSGPPGEKHPWATGLLFVGLPLVIALARTWAHIRRDRRKQG